MEKYIRKKPQNGSITKAHLKIPTLIGICGRSCSGKSVATKALETEFPDKILQISTDRYFTKFDPKELDKKEGWETPSPIRWDRLIHSLKKLKNNESTRIPSKGWTEVFDKVVRPKPIIIVEGYLLFTNPELVKLLDKRIFIDISDANILRRRMLRDKKLKGMQRIKGKDYIINKVIPISKQYEGMQKRAADIIIDGNASKETVLDEVKKYLKLY